MISPVNAAPYIKYTILTNNENESNQKVIEENLKHAPNGPYVVWDKNTIPSDPNAKIVRSYYSIEDSRQHYIDLFV